ncbi:MAG: sugar phosphate isomerase/epimerase [Parabacteroides sp.]|nr:sugar phosphate isomerase/epimerase [Parabacteroides sp.]
MKRIIISVCFLIVCCVNLAYGQYDMEGLKKLNWKISCQSYTFKEFSLVETLDKLNYLGIKYIELYPNQRISKDVEGETTYKMEEKELAKLKSLLVSKGITPLSYGVISPKTEEEWSKLFEFAKALKIQTIISEPSYDQLDLVEKLADKYKIKVAIHNHAAPTAYWDPEIILSKLKGRSTNLGVCADIGHFVRSGIEATEAVNKLRNRIICVHIKDINEFGIRSAHDLPWGTGYCNIPGVLRIIEKLGVKSNVFFTIEYEYNWKNSTPEIVESISYFYRLTHWMTTGY